MGNMSKESGLDPLTPVRLLKNHSAKSPSAEDSNFAAVKARLDRILQTLLDNYNKWGLAHRRGLALCQSIEAVKTRSLEATTPYPNELRPYCDKLAIIASIFVDITENTREALRQLRALHKLPGCNNAVFYRTWPLQQYIEMVVELLQSYEQETPVKQYVMTNLAHCTSRAELIRCNCLWEYPQYVDDWTTLSIALLREELKVKP